MDASGLAAHLGPWSNGEAPLYRLLADAVAGLVEVGVLRDGTRLPPERALADVLSVSRGTVVAAYERLRDQRLVERVQGRGTTVRTEPDRFDARPTTRIGDSLHHTPPASIDLLMAIPRALPRVIQLLSDIDWTAHTDALDDAEPAGIPALRARIAERTTADGWPTRAEEVLVTAGAQQGIDLVVQLLVRPGDVVLTEASTWPGLADTVRRVGGRVHGIELDEQGVVPEALAAAVERLRPALIGLNPHHHNPTGTRLPPHRRAQVAQIAAEYGVPMIEDRVAAWLAFDGVVPPPLAVHQPSAAHVVVDSVNKTAWPGLRLGWIRTDAALITQLRAARAAADLFSPIPSQVTALQVFDDLDGIVAERVTQLSVGAEVVLAELGRALPEWEVRRPQGGMVLWVRLPDASASEFARFATRYGVAVGTSRQFSTSAIDDEHLRIPFTRPVAELREAITRLAQAWDAFGRGSIAPVSAPPAAIV